MTHSAKASHRPTHSIASRLGFTKLALSSFLAAIVVVAMATIALVCPSQASARDSAPQAAAAAPNPASASSPSTAIAPAASSGAIVSDNRVVVAAIDELRQEINRKPNPWVASLFSGLAGGFIVALVAWFKETRDERRAMRTLSVQAIDKMMAWRLKQIESLYGPLNALLKQSHGVYKQLCDYLLSHDKSDPTMYRWVTDEESTTGFSFELFEKNQWRPFRLLDQLPNVYDQDSNAGPLIDEVMAVGKRIVGTIHSHAGLALVEQSELQAKFGEYLAHYVVLSEMYKAVKRKDANMETLRSRYTSGYFPRDIAKLVSVGLATISASLRSWECQLTSLADTNIQQSGTQSNG